MAAAVSGTSGSAGAFRKERPDAPRGFFEAEAAGLAWLAEAEPAGGA
ncbi:fructosamine kinase, partial [Clavibacter michiganensis]